MTALVTERILVPGNKDIRQLFVIFFDDIRQKENLDVLVQQICQHFENAAVVAVCHYPVQANKPDSWEAKLLQHIALSEAELAQMVMQSDEQYLAYLNEKRQEFGLPVEATALIGVGYAASVVLELTKAEQVPAGRVITFGGRYVQLPESLSLEQTIHLLHADEDEKINIHFARDTHLHIDQIQGDATVDIANKTKNSLDPVLSKRMIERLLTCVPLRFWQEADSGEYELRPTGPEADDKIH
ncbi:MAG: hypothetical protein PHN76_08155 [Advenella sp.]|mgnify:CR=1 FL=1|jgi:phospholipase/carboxylesterase|uniref:hypothetical protein n=1 Tax=unclassified Advenella TaxID=2685285 RepID=UPI00145CB8BE|nr:MULTISPECIES: hypothetical protein [unclassified Advenella]MDD3758125.1 hypothetical protein [Advenella sp.]NLN68926.1 hypothetical protein [Alcaligenaceae bacterium]